MRETITDNNIEIDRDRSIDSSDLGSLMQTNRDIVRKRKRESERGRDGDRGREREWFRETDRQRYW